MSSNNESESKSNKLPQRNISLMKNNLIPVKIESEKEKSIHNPNNLSQKIQRRYDFDFSTTMNMKLTDKCWNILSEIILENYRCRKGTLIKNFGKFTFVTKKK